MHPLLRQRLASTTSLSTPTSLTLFKMASTQPKVEYDPKNVRPSLNLAIALLHLALLDADSSPSDDLDGLLPPRTIRSSSLQVLLRVRPSSPLVMCSPFGARRAFRTELIPVSLPSTFLRSSHLSLSLVSACRGWLTVGGTQNGQIVKDLMKASFDAGINFFVSSSPSFSSLCLARSLILFALSSG
jgi:hypothetical protein